MLVWLFRYYVLFLQLKGFGLSDTNLISCMKNHKLNLLACLLCFLLAACSNQDAPLAEANAEGVATLSFSVINYRQTSLDDVESGDGTRAAGSVDTLAHLAFAVYDADGKCIVSQLQDKGAADYGSFQASLPYGHYTMVFLGYSGSEAVNLSMPTHISFGDDYVPNCFLRTLTVDVDASSTGAQPVTLSRCVGCFTITCQNGISPDMDAMTFQAQGGGTALNALTGYAAQVATRSGSFSTQNVKNRSDKHKFNIYAFLPAEQAPMDFTLSATSSKGGTLRTRTFPSVPMSINKRIIYEGDFFAQPSGSSAFTLQLENADWDEVMQTY